MYKMKKKRLYNKKIICIMKCLLGIGYYDVKKGFLLSYNTNLKFLNTKYIHANNYLNNSITPPVNNNCQLI